MKDYKKKYEEALGRARTFNQRWQSIEATDSELALQELKEIFPELKESEDGRMIKSLKRLIKAYYNVNFPTPEGFEREDMLAWLEKQTIDISSFPEEQRKYMEKYVNLDKTTLVKLLAERDENIEESLKASICDECEHPTLNCGNFPCDKVTKPKFKVGDTIVEKDVDECDYETIKDIKNGRYIFTDGYCMDIDEQEGWQLVKTPAIIEQKSKDEPKFKVGDWVVNNETGTIHQIKEIVKLNCGYAYNLTDGGYISSFKSDEYRLWTINDAKYGILNKKELKQIKQDATCNKYIADVFEKVGLAKIVREKGSDELTCAVQDAMIELSKFIPQSKQEWSEEDELIYQHCLTILHDYGYDNWFKEKIKRNEI